MRSPQPLSRWLALRLPRVGRRVNPSEAATLQELVQESMDLVAGRSRFASDSWGEHRGGAPIWALPVGMRFTWPWSAATRRVGSRGDRCNWSSGTTNRTSKKPYA